MSIVPIVPASPPSPRAHELGGQLKTTIEEFCRNNPGMTSNEIRQAMSLARTREGAGNQVVIVALLLAGVALLGVLTYFYFGQRAPVEEPQPILMMMIIGIGIVAIGVAAVLKNR